MEILKKIKQNYIKHLFIYKVYRIFKYKPLFSHSSFGEEILVNRILKKKHGFYIDVGALNPKVGSLTFLLYKKGWRGINFDLTKSNIQLFRAFRKRDISVQLAISNKKARVTSYIFDPGSGLNSLEKNMQINGKKNFLSRIILKKLKVKHLIQ